MPSYQVPRDYIGHRLLASSRNDCFFKRMTSRDSALYIFNNSNMYRAMGLIPSTAPPRRTEREDNFKDRFPMSNYILPIIAVSRELGKHALPQGLGPHTRHAHLWVF